MIKKLWKPFKRKLKLYRQYFRMNLDELEVYDKDFIFGVVSMFISYAAGILSLFFIFDFVHEINGWTLKQILFMYGLNLIGYSLWSCFFINTISLPYYIRRGEFDRFLLRPIEPIFQIMMDGFDEDSWGELIIGLAVFTYAWIQLEISVWYVFLIPIIALSSCFIYAGTSIVLSTVSFFTVSQADVANFTFEIRELAQYPITIYPKIFQIIFTFIFPVAFVAFFPSAALFDKIPIWLIALVPIVAFGYYKLSKLIWNIGVKHYCGTGT